ncbi:type II secretion system protein [Patescibacteria group bacterium]
MLKRENKGFTLIELLVVITIIGILAAVILASFGGARTKSRIASMQSGLRGVLPDITMCSIDGQALNAPVSGTILCTGSESSWPTLPSAGTWSYASTDLFTANDGVGDFSITASGDSVVITCTEGGCTTI